MKTSAVILAAAFALAAAADITQFAPTTSLEDSPGPAKVIGIKANSSAASGTVSIKEIVTVSTSSTACEITTNIVQRRADYRVADAYVGMTRVHSGTDATAWIKWDSEVTNVTAGVTNVVTYHLGKWCDGATTNSVVYTNSALSIAYTDVIRYLPATNVVYNYYKVLSSVPMTNTIFTGTLSSGALDQAISNKFILGGSKLIADGTVYATNATSSVYLILER